MQRENRSRRLLIYICAHTLVSARLHFGSYQPFLVPTENWRRFRVIFVSVFMELSVADCPYEDQEEIISRKCDSVEPNTGVKTNESSVTWCCVLLSDAWSGHCVVCPRLRLYKRSPMRVVLVRTQTPWVPWQQCDTRLRKPPPQPPDPDWTKFGCGSCGSRRWPACFSSSSSSASELCAARRAGWKRRESERERGWMSHMHSSPSSIIPVRMSSESSQPSALLLIHPWSERC